MKRARQKARGVMHVATLAILLVPAIANAADRATEICRNPGDTREPLSVAAVVTTLGPLSGLSRHRARRCVEPRIPASLAGADLARIAGEATDHRERMIGTLRGHVRDELSAGDAVLALGALSGLPRYVAVKCLEPKLASQLSEQQVNPIAGEGLIHRGAVIRAIERKTVEGMNAAALREYMARFPSRRFLGEGDPPAWLDGQCIAWARTLYTQISGRSVDGIAFGSARNIPAELGERGFEVVADPRQARVGAMVVWDEGAAGHVAVVTSVTRDGGTGAATGITVSEANFGRVTAAGVRKWGLTESDARAAFATDKYGMFDEPQVAVSKLYRGLFKFVGYVYP